MIGKIYKEDISGLTPEVRAQKLSWWTFNKIYVTFFGFCQKLPLRLSLSIRIGITQISLFYRFRHKIHLSSSFHTQRTFSSVSFQTEMLLLRPLSLFSAKNASKGQIIMESVGPPCFITSGALETLSSSAPMYRCTW